MGQDLHVVLVLETERQGERGFGDFPERGVRVERLGRSRPGQAGPAQAGRSRPG
jgi:hypothetical protein